MNTRKSRAKTKLNDDIPIKDVLTPNNRSGKKTVLTPCRRIGLGRKKASKGIPVVSDLKNEDLTSLLPTTSQENGECSSLSNALPSSSTSEVVTTPSPTVEVKPKSSASRRKKSSHPLKRKIDDTDKNEGNTYKVIVSPVIKKRKLEIIDIFNSDSQNLSNITDNKIVINNVKNKNSDNILTKNSLKQNKVNTTAKNKQNVAVKVSLPLEITKKVLNSPILLKSDKKEFSDSNLKCDDKLSLLSKKLNVSSDVNLKTSETIAVTSENSSKVLLPEMKPIKKRKLREKFNLIIDETPVININKEETTNHIDVKLPNKNVEEELTVNKLSEKINKKTKNTSTPKTKTKNKSLTPKNKRNINNISKDLNESKNNDFDDDFQEFTPKNKKKITIKNKKIVNVRATPKRVKKEKPNLNTTEINATSGRKKKNVKKKLNENIISEENHMVENINTDLIVDETLSLSQIEPKQMEVKNDNSIITTDKASETTYENINLSNAQVSNTSQITEINEIKSNIEPQVVERSDIIVESTVLEKSELEITIKNKDIEKTQNVTRLDKRIIKSPKTKAEKKFYNIETPTRVERKISLKNRDNKSPPKLNIRVHKIESKSKMDDEQLLINEDSYESSHYSTPAYSPIEETVKLPEDKELIIQRCEFVKLSPTKKDNIIYECRVKNSQSPELKKDLIVNNECASSFVQNEQNVNLNAENILPVIENKLTTINKEKDVENQEEIVENQEKIVENQENVGEKQNMVVENQENVSEYQEKVTEKEEKIVENQEQITECQEKVTENIETVTEKEEKVAENQEQVIEHQGEVTGNLEEVIEKVAENQEQVIEYQENVAENHQEKVVENQENIADKQENVAEKQENVAEKQQMLEKNEEEAEKNQEEIVATVSNDILCNENEKSIPLAVVSSKKNENSVSLVDDSSESDLFLPSKDIFSSRKKENVFKKGKSVKNSRKGKSIVQKNVLKTDVNADKILQNVKKGLRITKSLPFNNKTVDAIVEDCKSNEAEPDKEKVEHDKEKVEHHKEKEEASGIISPPKKPELLNYYPRVLLNADAIDNYYKEIKLQQNKVDEITKRVNKTTPIRKKSPGRRKNFGTRGRKRKRKNSEVVIEVEIIPEKNFDSHIQEKNLIISRVENFVSEETTEKSKFKKDKDIQKHTESVFFTPPSSRSENDSDSNRNDFHIDVELTITNPFGEGTSRLGISKQTEEKTLRNLPISDTPISQENYTLEDEEVAGLSSKSSSVKSIGKRKVSSRSSPTHSNVSTTKIPFSDDSDDDFQTPKSKPRQIPSKQYLIKNESGIKCILKKPIGHPFKQYQLNENSFVSQMHRGNVMEYIKSHNNYKKITKPERRSNNKSLIQNRCVYSSSPETISSIFDSVIEDPEAYLQSQKLPPQRIDVEQEIKTIQKRIKEKQAKIEHLRVIHTYKKKHELENLHKANTKMIKGAQEALLELAAVLRQRSDTPFDMSTLLGNMNIPHHVVCYNMDLDEFTK